MKELDRNRCAAATLECPACGSTKITTRRELDLVEFGERDEAKTISVEVPVRHCDSCNMSFTDEVASAARHDAVCRHIGVLTPDEVKSVRDLYQLSQAEFSEVSKIGKASLARWERGALIQNQANDNLLFLLTFAENLQRLKGRIAGTVNAFAKIELTGANVVPIRRHRFPTISQSEIEQRRPEAEAFELYAARAV